jgi:hypothetical protein
MSRLDLSTLSIPDAQLIQRGLASLGIYDGTFLGKPGPKTQAAYDQFQASSAAVAAPAPELPGGKSLAVRLVEILMTKEGVREIPLNSNRGPDVEAFQAATWLSGTGWAWCAAFVCWGIRELGKEFTLPFARPETAAAYGFEEWARQQGLKLFKPCSKILKGDILIFGPISHICVAVADESGGYVETIEGNTDSGGSREGNGVYRRRRAKSMFRSHVRLEKKA